MGSADVVGMGNRGVASELKRALNLIHTVRKDELDVEGITAEQFDEHCKIVWAKGNPMARDPHREPMPISDDDGSFRYEVWKESAFLDGFAKFEDARAVCDRGNRQSGNFEVRSKGETIWPKPPAAHKKPRSDS
jgi:hypothetical protein